MIDKDSDGRDIRTADVVDESCDVAVLACVDAKRVGVAVVEIEQIRVVLAHVRLQVCDDFSHVFAHVCALFDPRLRTHAPALAFCPKHL